MLYVNISKEQIQSTDSVEVLNYNLLDDFFFYLGEAIVGNADLQVDKIALIKDFDTPENTSDFNKILNQWEELELVLFGEKPEGEFEVKLPDGYIDWLRYSNNDEYRKIYSLRYSNNGRNVVNIDVEDFYTCCIKGDLLRKIKSIVNEKNLNFINIKHQQFKATSMFVEVIKETIGRLCIETVILFYDEISLYGDLYKVKKNGRWGCLDKFGKEIIPLLYDEISLCGDLYKVKKDGRWGCLDKFGKEIIPLLYDGISLCGNLYKVNVGGRITFLNEKGESFYDELEKAFLSDSFCVRKNGKWGFVNSCGREIVPCLNDEIIKQAHDVAYIKRDNKYTLVNIKDGSVLLPFCNRYLFWRKDIGYYENWFQFNDDCLCVEKGENRRCGFIKSDGTLLTEFIYESGRAFSEGFAVVKRNGKYGFINQKGMEVISCKYDFAQSFSDGFACVTIKDKYGREQYGFIDKNGKEAIPCQYKYACNFHEGLCYVESFGFFRGYINENGEKITNEKLSIWGHSDFKNGIAAVKIYPNEQWGFIDKTGVIIAPHIYDDSDGFPAIGSLVRVKRNGCFGCLNSKGEEEIPCIYDKIDLCYDFTEVTIKTLHQGKVVYLKYR